MMYIIWFKSVQNANQSKFDYQTNDFLLKLVVQRSNHILNSTEAREPTGFEGQRSKVPAALFLLQ